jgi:hypothetical protein
MAIEQVEDFAEFEIVVGEEEDYCAGTSGTRDRALKEAVMYANQYLEGGDVRIYEVSRVLVMELLGTDE